MDSTGHSGSARSILSQRNLYVYVVAIVLLLLASFVSREIVLAVESAVAETHIKATSQIYFAHPSAINRGISPGGSVEVIVTSSRSSSIKWEAFWSTKLLKRFVETGTVHVSAGKSSSFSIVLSGAQHGSWFEVAIPKNRLRLRAWIQ